MENTFKKFIKLSYPFIVIRFLVSLAVSVFYILIGAFIQYQFISLLGESTFNYIVGGLLSLFLGVMFCRSIGAIIFMFVKAWHISALAYADKIISNELSPVDVGSRAFSKNLISFGTVYILRGVINNILFNAKERIWELFDNHPLGQVCKRASSNPMISYIGKDILYFGFDATVFYIVKERLNNADEILTVSVTAVKKYLCCLPAIMLTSLKIFILLRILPQVLKIIIVLVILFTQGFVAGILITVLMYPISYILENTLFDPIIMSMFLAEYSEKCYEELDEHDPIMEIVNSILNDESLGTSEECKDEGEGASTISMDSVETSSDANHEDIAESISVTINDESDLGLSSSSAGLGSDSLRELDSLIEDAGSVLESLPFEDSNNVERFSIDDDSDSTNASMTLEELANNRLSILSAWNGGGLDDDPLSDEYDGFNNTTV